MVALQAVRHLVGYIVNSQFFITSVSMEFQLDPTYFERSCDITNFHTRTAPLCIITVDTLAL